uniref:Large ribosomal subunit protein mL54 n=1 Tax=Leersia perrieri TaxID=77586 RepID=A0A0D9XY70_9ORYZ
MAMACRRVLKHGVIPRDSAQVIGIRSFAIASKAKKGGKGGADVAKTPVLSKELKTTTVFGANILKEGSDPKLQPDSEYPEWLWHLLDKCPMLSELRRKDAKTLPYEDLKRFVKLVNRARIKEQNALTAKN